MQNTDASYAPFGFAMSGQPDASSASTPRSAEETQHSAQASLLDAVPDSSPSAPWLVSQDITGAASLPSGATSGGLAQPSSSTSAPTTVPTEAAPAKTKKARKSKNAEESAGATKRNKVAPASKDRLGTDDVEEGEDEDVDDMMDVDDVEAGAASLAVGTSASPGKTKLRKGKKKQSSRKSSSNKGVADDGTAGPALPSGLASGAPPARPKASGTGGSAHASAYTIAAAFRRPKASENSLQKEREASTLAGAASSSNAAAAAQEGTGASASGVAPAEEEEEVDDLGEEEDDEVEEDVGLVQEEAQRQKELSEARKSVLGAMMRNMTPEQLDRFEAYSRTAISRPNMKRLVNHVLQQSVSDQIATIFAGAGKIFVGEIVELARDIAAKDPEWVRLSEGEDTRERPKTGVTSADSSANADGTDKHGKGSGMKQVAALAPHHLRGAAHRYRAERERPGRYAPAGGAPGLGNRRTLF